MTNSIQVKKYIINFLTSLLVISAGLNIFQLNKKKNLQEQADVAKLTADSILSVQLMIEREYHKVINDLDEHKEKCLEIDAMLASSKKQIIGYKNKINSLQKDNANVKMHRKQLAQLTQMKKSFEMKVTALLKTKEDLENELNASVSQNISMKREMSELHKKIESAKFLVANNIKVKWLKVKNGKSKVTKQPSRANQLEITFNINSNPFAPVGDRNILVSLYDPKGQLVKNSKSGRNFSFAKLFKYEQKAEQVVLYVDLQQKPLKGKYKLEISIDGDSRNKYEFTLIDDVDNIKYEKI